MTDQPEPEIGDIWISRYTTGLRVVITDIDGSRVRIADIDSRSGTPRARGRWATSAQLASAYRPEAS